MIAQMFLSDPWAFIATILFVLIAGTGLLWLAIYSIFATLCFVTSLFSTDTAEVMWGVLWPLHWRMLRDSFFVLAIWIAVKLVMT